MKFIAFIYLLVLLMLIAANIYFFHSLSTHREPARNNSIVPKTDPTLPNLILLTNFIQHLNLPIQYHKKHPKFVLIQKKLISSFNSSGQNIDNVWNSIDRWADEEFLFPTRNGAAGQVLQALRTSQITLADNAPKGTQLKLQMLVENKYKILFKPKRYSKRQVITGSINAGFDRHNSEVLTYYLAMILNYKWVVPSVLRQFNFIKDILPHATVDLQKTMVTRVNGPLCIYGKCIYCHINDAVCPDRDGVIKGAVILYLNETLESHESPWRRSNETFKIKSNTDQCFNNKVLNIIDVAIIDFLIQNGDRHSHEVYHDKIVLLDNGKGLGNPMVDHLDILAPLYECCILSYSTWKSLRLVSGGSLTQTIKLLSSFHGGTDTSHDHYEAIERRLLKVYAVVEFCVEEYGEKKVFINKR